MRFLNDIDGSGKVKQDIDNRFVTDAEKEDISKIKNKADKTYVDDRVKTPVPLNALFTDTVLTKESLGIERVENKSAVDIIDEITMQKLTNILGYTPMNLAIKGVAGGVAELNESGKIPAAQLPSYVDDVMEFPTKAEFPVPGEKGKIYTAKDTNVIYRWSGTDYIEISASLALGDSEGTAYPGDLGKIAYDHSQSAHAPVDAQKNSLITKAEIEAKLTGVIGTHNHIVTKEDVGLSNVDNTSDLAKPVSTATQTEIDTKTGAVAEDLANKSATLTQEQERVSQAQTDLVNDINNRLKTNVPLNAKFTDTITSVNGKTGAITKADIIALGISEEGIPGEKGDKGEPGAPGPKGDTGPRGPQGIQGTQGPKGEKGDPFIYSDFTSAQLEALKGPKGDKGDTGPQGIKGATGATGLQGPIGKTGPKGDTGEQGPRGFKGDKGETGAASTIPGPRGHTGARGLQGLKGDTGPQGPQGLKGDTGVPGAKGDKGDTGPRGPQGLKGDTGPQGPRGLTGAASTVPGPKGDTGARGPQGLRGNTGPRGAVGPQGIVGPVGGTIAPYLDSRGNLSWSFLSSSEIDEYNPPVESNIIGPRGLQGPQGPKGDTGTRGLQGPRGYTGSQGPQGDKGDTGIRGLQGPRGSQGPQGPKGDTGARGPTGARGATGATGSQGPRGYRGYTGAAGNDGIHSSWTNGSSSWVKFNDGMQICYSYNEIPTGYYTAWGGMYYQYLNWRSWTFPASFYEPPVFMGSTHTAVHLIANEATSTTAAGGIQAWRPVSTSQPVITVKMVAIGRWKA